MTEDVICAAIENQGHQNLKILKYLLTTHLGFLLTGRPDSGSTRDIIVFIRLIRGCKSASIRSIEKTHILILSKKD